MAATKIVIPIFYVLVTCSQLTLAAPWPRGHSFIKQPGSSSSRDGSSTTRYSTSKHVSTTPHPSAISPIPLNDTFWIMSPPPALQTDGLSWKSNKGDVITPREIPSSNTAGVSTSTSPFITPPPPSISNDGLYTAEPFTTPPAPILQNGGLHSATPLSPPTSSLPSASTKWPSSASMVEPLSRSATGLSVLPQTTPAPQ